MEQVTGIPDGVTIVLGLVILFWAVLRAARSYGGALGETRRRDGTDEGG